MSLLNLDQTSGAGAVQPLPERRRHKRHNLTLLGRFMRANKQEFPCKTIDISVGGVALSSPVDVDVNERIVAYFDLLGGIEGKVARRFDGGFALSLVATQHKREKLAAQITWLLNRDHDGHDARRHDRLPVDELSTLKLADDIAVKVRLMDVSISGASVQSEARPPIGAEVVLGRLRGRIIRHHDHGFAVQFLDIQKPDAVRRYFG